MPNTLKQKLASGKPVLNGWLNIASGFTAELMALAGFDSVVVDLQHGLHDYASMVACLQAIQGLPVTPMVRVAWNEPIMIGRALDAGAQGVIAPMISTREHAENFVSHCKYPPLGRRSNGPIRAGLYGHGQNYQAHANEETLCIPIIETREGVDNLPAILDVEGVDGVYAGPSDLRVSYGLPLRIERNDPAFATMLRRYEVMLAECDKRGLFACMHSPNQEDAAYYIAMGFRLVTISSDSDSLAAAARNIVSQFRATYA